MPNFNLLNKEIKKSNKNYDVLTLDKQTDGQARTVAICANNIKQKINYIDEIITIGTCDSGVIFDHKKFNEIIKNENSDVIVWGIKNYPNAQKNPNMYGWINQKNGLVTSISVKKPLEIKKTSPIVLGIFTFKNLTILRRL